MSDLPSPMALIEKGRDFGPAAEAVQVSDQKSYELAAAFVQTMKTWVKKVEDVLKPDIQEANAHHKALTKQRTDILTPSRAALSIVQQKMSRYMLDVRRREAEEKKLLEAEAEAMGFDTSLVPEIKTAPKVKGISYVKRWTFEVTEIEKVPAKYMMVDEAKVNQDIKTHKGKISIPGIRVIEISPRQVVRGS